MPSGRDVNAGRRGGGTTKKNAFCSFCRKSYRDVGPLVEGPGDVYICGECIELCQSILEQERRRRGTSKQLFTQDSHAARNRHAARRIRHRPGARQEGAGRRRPQPLQAADARRRRLGRRNRQVEHPADRPDRLRQDAAGPHAGPDPQRAVRHRRRHHADRSRLRRRGRREPAARSCCTRPTSTSKRPSAACSTSTKSTRSARRARTSRSPATCRAKACSRPCSRCSKAPLANVPPQGGRKHPEQQYIQMDTSNILFICGGTFVGLDEIIGKRLGKRTIGFGQESGVRAETELARSCCRRSPATTFSSSA